MEKLSPKVIFTTGLALQLGFSLAAPLVLFIALGIWLDKRFGMPPLFTLGGVILALAVSALELYRVIQRARDTKN